MSQPVVIFLRAGDWEARNQALTLAASAAALGDAVYLALSGAALCCLIEDRFGEGAPPQALLAKVPPLDQTLEELRRDLGVHLVACDTAIRLAGFDPGMAVPPLDAVMSMLSLWRLVQVGRALTV